MSESLKSCVAEAIATFMLCFIGAGVIVMNQAMGGDGPGLLGIAIAHGLALSIAVSATMNVSGGHVNPAVTVAMLATGRIGAGRAFAYIVSQCLGGVIAGVLVFVIFRGGAAGAIAAANLGTPALNAGMGITPGLGALIEACLTFLLLFAVFGTAADPRHPSIGGFGIGLTIGMDILVGGPLTGAAMNPARAFGPGLVAFLTGNHAAFVAQQWIYWVGPILGGVLAGVIYDKCIINKRS